MNAMSILKNNCLFINFSCVYLCSCYINNIIIARTVYGKKSFAECTNGTFKGHAATSQRFPVI